MHRRLAPWEVKRPLFVSGLVAVAVTAIALKASLAVTLACVIPLILLLGWKRLWLCATIALCFLLLAVGYRHIYQRPTVGLDGEVDRIRGEVVSDITHGGMYMVRVTQSDYLPQGSRLMLYCPEDDLPLPGDTLEATVRLYATKDNQTYYAAQQAFTCAFPAGDPNEDIRVLHHAKQKVGPLQHLRTALVGAVRAALPAREGGLLSALCFGETDYISANEQTAFRGSGLSHLLVVSGLHLSMVALALRRLFRRFGMRLCCGMTLGATWLFALFVGTSPSVVRAATMLSLWLVGCLLFRRSDGLNALGLAAILLLTINPYHLWNVGFQLSFAATCGVLVLAHRLPAPEEETADMPWYQRLWNRIRKTAWAGGVVCIAALLFSLPVAAWHYGGFPITTLLTNLLAGPAAGAAMLCGWLGALCGLIPFMGWLCNGLLLIAGLLIRYMGEVARIGSPHWGWITVSHHWQWLLLTAFCALIVGALLWRVPRKRVMAMVATLAVLVAGVAIPLTAAPVSLTVVSVDNEAGFILKQGQRCALIVTQLRDLNEVVYATPTFEPDVVVILDGDPSAVIQATRWPKATIVAATPNQWFTANADAADLPVGGVVDLWQSCRLTRLDDTWVAVQIGEETVCIGTDPTTTCPLSEGWHIYVGKIPAVTPTAPYTVVCNNAGVRRNSHRLNGDATIINDTTITFTPLRGEWRRMQWLWR